MPALLSRLPFPAPVTAKVPQITAMFWSIKILTTGMGEAASDYLSATDLVLAGAVGLLGFLLSLWLQFRTDHYSPAVYWFAVAMVAVFGTMAADALHKGLGIPYAGSTVCYAIVLAVVLALWYRSEGTLSIHSIVTTRREIYYWITVLATFALGTAAGDLTAAGLHLGYLNSALLFAGIIAIPVLGWWRFRLHPVVAFWFAYIVTRPLGASVADWLGKRARASGLGWGDGPVTTGAILLIALLVGYLVVRGGNQPTPAAESSAESVHDPVHPQPHQ